jgi:hypothetical protein
MHLFIRLSRGGYLGRMLSFKNVINEMSAYDKHYFVKKPCIGKMVNNLLTTEKAFMT